MELNMFRATLVVAMLALNFSAGAVAVRAQEKPPEKAPEVPREMRARKLATQSLMGPRFGFTAFTGDVAELRQKADLEPIITQFGWQWEKQLVSQGGSQALLEWVLLFGGVEQNEFNSSLGWMTGYRMKGGFEVGAGPNFSVTKQMDRITTSMVVAAGSTLPFGDIYVPVNLAVAMAKGGPRITVLTGWVMGG
jgi:hypothetical protein